jgi:hypothetical protein
MATLTTVLVRSLSVILPIESSSNKTNIVKTLISHQGFTLRSWALRGTNRVAVCLVPSNQPFDEAQNMFSSTPLNEQYINAMLNPISWLPFVVSHELKSALPMLEKKLSYLPSSQLIRDSTWGHSVATVMSDLNNMVRKNQYTTRAFHHPAARINIKSHQKLISNHR